MTPSRARRSNCAINVLRSAWSSCARRSCICARLTSAATSARVGCATVPQISSRNRRVVSGKYPAQACPGWFCRSTTWGWLGELMEPTPSVSTTGFERGPNHRESTRAAHAANDSTLVDPQDGTRRAATDHAGLYHVASCARWCAAPRIRQRLRVTTNFYAHGAKADRGQGGARNGCGIRINVRW